MVNEFSYTEIQIIQSFLSSKPVDYIAMIIDRPVDQVQEQITVLISGTKRLQFKDIKLKEELRNKIARENVRRFKEQDRLHKIKGVIPIKSGKGDKKFELKKVDYSKMVLVKIDSKTCIQIKPGQDIEQARNNFLKMHKRYSISGPVNPWEKFKPKKCPK